MNNNFVYDKDGYIVVLGKRYSTIEDVCLAYRTTSCLVTSRLARGWGILDALTRPAHTRSNPHTEVVINGVTYPSLSAACREKKIKYTL